MRSTVIALAIAAILTGKATSQTVDKEKLRKAAKMPSIETMFFAGVNCTGKFTFAADKSDPRSEIDKLKTTLKGDASDAPRYYRLGRQYDELDNAETEAKECFAKAVSLYCEQLQKQPADAALLAEYALALTADNKAAEAEALLRQTIAATPQAWQCWHTLGVLLDHKRHRILLDAPKRGWKGKGGCVALILQQKPSPERVQKWRDLQQEVEECFDKAVSLAPGEALPYAGRAAHRICVGQILCGLRMLAGEEGPTPFDSSFPPACVADLRKAAELQPDDYRAVTMAIFSEVFPALSRQLSTIDATKKSALQCLSEKERYSLRVALGRLEKISQGQDARAAAGALEVQGMLYAWITRDTAQAVTCLERAVLLDPSRDNAWELLQATLAELGAHDRTLKAANDRVRYRDSAHNRYCLARAHIDLGQLDKAEEQLRLALKLEPTDFRASLGLAAILLKRSDDPRVLDEVSSAMGVAWKALGESPSSSQLAEFKVTAAIYLALRGELDRASEQLNDLLEEDPENKPAKEALRALGQ